LNFRALFFRLPVVLALFLCFGIDSFGLQERLVRISPILIKWNANAQLFHAYFDVTNDSSEDVDLTSIIIFKVGKFKRWRGVPIPIVKAKKTGSYKISFAPGIMLKNEYISITVNIYGKNYVGLIDYSSRYVKISSRRVITEGKTQIELVELVPTKGDVSSKKMVEGLEETVEAPPQTSKRMIDLGPAEKRLQLLATERFQNALLEPVSTEEKHSLIEMEVVELHFPPENFIVTPETYQNRLTWDPVEGATAYHLYWGKSAGLTRENGTRIANVTSGYVHSDLKEWVDFYYILTVVKDGLESEPSIELSGKPIIEAPSPPEMFTVTPETYQNRLTWDPVEGATAYHLYWGKSEGLTRENGIKIENVTSGFIHADLKEAIDFYYILTVVRDGLESEPTVEIIGKPIMEAPSPPEMFTATPGEFQIQLTWKPVTGTTTYNLYWSKLPDLTRENSTKIENVTSAYIHADLKDAVDFYYILTAVKDGLESEPSIEITAIPKILPRGTPQLTIIGGDKSLLLSWTMVKGATEYHLYWGISPKLVPSDENRIVVQGNSFEHTGLENDRPYYYVIAAANFSGEGKLSAMSNGLSEPRRPI
jgi:hypothetical protein